MKFVYANDAFKCMRFFEKTNSRGRKCFARPCNEQTNVESMNRDESNQFAATLTGNDDIIFKKGDEDFGKANFGKPTYAESRSKSSH